MSAVVGLELQTTGVEENGDDDSDGDIHYDKTATEMISCEGGGQEA